jgi:hypothetical protein
LYQQTQQKNDLAKSFPAGRFFRYSGEIRDNMRVWWYIERKNDRSVINK